MWSKWAGCTRSCPLACAWSSQALRHQGAKNSGAPGRNKLQERTLCCVELTMQLCPGWLCFPLPSSGTVAQLCKESVPILFWFQTTPDLFCSPHWLQFWLYLQCLTLQSLIEADSSPGSLWDYWSEPLQRDNTKKNPSVKALSFQSYIHDYCFLELVCLECICSNDGLSCWSVRREDQLLFHTHLCRVWPQVIVEGIGLWHRILCPLLGGLLASFLPLDCHRKECLVKWRCECKLE